MKLILSYLLLGIAVVFSAFETVDIDARAKAMGSAITAKKVSGSAIIANPSHLSVFDKLEASVSILPMDRGLLNSSILQASGNFVLPIKRLGGVGVSYKGLFVQANTVSLYQEHEIALGIGVALGSSFQLGLTGIVQILTIDPALKQTYLPLFNLTVGFTYNFNDSLSIGLVGANLIGNLIAMNTSSSPTGTPIKNAVPIDIKLGVAHQTPKNLIALDAIVKIINTGISEFTVKIGGETYLNKKMFILGLGVEFIGIYQGINPSIGLGINLANFTVNYAFSYPLLAIGGAGDHIFSATVKF